MLSWTREVFDCLVYIFAGALVLFLYFKPYMLVYSVDNFNLPYDSSILDSFKILLFLQLLQHNVCMRHCLLSTYPFPLSAITEFTYVHTILVTIT